MKKQIIIFAVILVAITCSCKKSSSTSGGSGSTSTSGVYGYLIATNAFGINTATGSLYHEANTGLAYFFSDPLNAFSYIAVGSVWGGTKKFSFQSYATVYSDTTHMMNINPTTWQVTGAGTIPSFTYTNNDSLPAYTGFVSLPDTIYKNQSLTIHVDGVSGASGGIQIILGDGTSNAPAHQIDQLLTSVSTNNTFTIPAASLSGFTVSTSAPGYLQVNFQKFNDQPMSGKTFRFISKLQIDKHVYIK